MSLLVLGSVTIGELTPWQKSDFRMKITLKCDTNILLTVTRVNLKYWWFYPNVYFIFPFDFCCKHERYMKMVNSDQL